MRILLADDERPARAELQFILEQIAANAEFAEAKNGQEVLDHVADHPVDVIFLDINMPGINGLSAASAIVEMPDPPLIVFATAYDSHAVRAFDLAALDYIVKPYSEARLAQAMVRIRQALEQRTQRVQQQNALRSYLHTATQTQSPADPASGTLAKLWAERENKTAVLVDYADILWIEAAEKRVFVQTSAGEKLALRQTIKELEPRLLTHNIVRVHKAYLVNLDHIAEVVPWFSGTYQLRMTDEANSEIPMSRQYAKTVKKLSGYL